jgi:hypothetical protein
VIDETDNVCVRGACVAESFLGRRTAARLIPFIVFQVTLGALTVLGRRRPWINSRHVVGGTVVLDDVRHHVVGLAPVGFEITGL